MGAVPTVAYLAEGKLYVVKPGGPARLVESPFVQGILDRAERARQRNEWKQEGMAWNINAGRGFGGMPRGGGGGAPAEVRRVRYTGLSAAGPGGRELLYAIETDHVSGLFTHNLADGTERRLVHRNQFRPSDLARRDADGTLALSVAAADGTAQIAVIDADGRGVREITEGDSVDESPAWVPGDRRVLLFQSAGVGRNQQGFRVETGPYAIQRLDLDAGDMSTVVEDGGYDYLAPRAGGDGAVYYIRRPYESRRPRVSPLKVVGDIVMFPWRLGVAVVHFLNFFSIMFARKPLLTAGGPPKEGPDTRFLMLWGKVIDAERALNRSKGGDGRALVPTTWELVRRTADGTEDVLAQSVLAYDLLPDGAVVYSNGTTVFLRDPAGAVSEVCTGKLVERVVVLP